MHSDNLSAWQHDHVFDTAGQAAEARTRAVAWITAVTMVVEVFAGWWFNSMALLADGWHMSSHAVAIGLSAFAYAAARRYARDPRFAFGTWKIEVLGGFASAIILMGVAVLMIAGSVERLLSPQPIRFHEAIAVAVLGLLVNLVCALILGASHHPRGHHAQDRHAHGHASDHHHHHHHDHAGTQFHHHDLNLKSVYLHVMADAATSVLAIIALIGGLLYGWSWLDPVMGLVGAALVIVWAKGLLAETGAVLLDREMDHPVVEEIRNAVQTGPEAGETRIADLHVWRVGKRAYACALTLVTHDADLGPARVRELLAPHGEIVHATIEIQVCPRRAE